MDLQRLLFFCLCVFSALVTLRAQLERCGMVVATDLGTPENSTDGFIAFFFGGGDAANRPMVSVQNVEVVSLTVSDVQDMFQWASVIAEYTCTGQPCNIIGDGETVTRTEQFELQCVDGGWRESTILADDRNAPENPSLTTADLRKNCSFSISPEDASRLMITNPVDSAFHCAACDPSCLSGVEGLGYCTTVQASGCCNVYQPRDGVNMCALSCDAGYEANMDSNFICERRCPELTDPVRGTVSNPSRTVNSTAMYTCDTGFRICKGDQTRTCRDDSTWDGENVVCAVCPTLPDPANGSVTTNGFCVGDTATYTCVAGYTVEGNETRTCEGSAWSLPAPTCERRCPTLPDPSNGEVSHESRTVGSMAIYICFAGFTIVGGDQTRTCLANSTWDGEAAVCADCPTLSNPTNGMVTTTGFLVGDMATYTCADGFLLDGDEVRTCQVSGWNPTAPMCVVDCGELTPPQFGQVDLPETTFGSTATYSCNGDRELTGDMTRTCQADGMWSGTSPECGTDSGGLSLHSAASLLISIAVCLLVHLVCQ